MSKKGSCRKWFCRCSKINNTKDKGIYEYDFEKLYQTLIDKYDNILFALHDKDKDNLHCHIVIQNASAIEFGTLLNLMPYGDIDKQRGTNLECYKYCLHIDDKSKETEKDIYEDNCLKTNIKNFDLWKSLKNEKGSRSDLLEIFDMIKNGASDYDIQNEFPSQSILYGKSIAQARQTYLRGQHANEFRNLQVIYIYGSAGVGKTRYVMEKFGYQNVYRVTDYGTGAFDGYNGQSVIMFDEFRSQIKISNMLTYLDGYPVDLPCRFSNKPALFIKVFIVSNVPLYEQYKVTRVNEPETFNAFLRRLSCVYYMDKSGTTLMSVSEAMLKPSLSDVNFSKY